MKLLSAEERGVLQEAVKILRSVGDQALYGSANLIERHLEIEDSFRVTPTPTCKKCGTEIVRSAGKWVHKNLNYASIPGQQPHTAVKEDTQHG